MKNAILVFVLLAIAGLGISAIANSLRTPAEATTETPEIVPDVIPEVKPEPPVPPEEPITPSPVSPVSDPEQAPTAPASSSCEGGNCAPQRSYSAPQPRRRWRLFQRR